MPCLSKRVEGHTSHTDMLRRSVQLPAAPRYLGGFDGGPKYEINGSALPPCDGALALPISDNLSTTAPAPAPSLPPGAAAAAPSSLDQLKRECWAARCPVLRWREPPPLSGLAITFQCSVDHGIPRRVLNAPPLTLCCLLQLLPPVEALARAPLWEPWLGRPAARVRRFACAAPGLPAAVPCFDDHYRSSHPILLLCLFSCSGAGWAWLVVPPQAQAQAAATKAHTRPGSTSPGSSGFGLGKGQTRTPAGIA